MKKTEKLMRIYFNTKVTYGDDDDDDTYIKIKTFKDNTTQNF